MSSDDVRPIGALQRPNQLPEGFQFSQGSLQDFVDCRRRFQLRYLWQLAWPALESEPALENERWMKQGNQFHHMVHQHLVGVPADQLSARAKDQDLAHWWSNYLNYASDLIQPPDLVKRYAEISLSAPYGGNRLVAKYDLLLVRENGAVTIVDWKTSRRLPRRDLLVKRLQTVVYRYLLVAAGGDFCDDTPIAPEKVSMLYWFTEFPDRAILLPYSTAEYEADDKRLGDLFKLILRQGDGDYPLTPDEKRCQFCVYRSLCARGVQAGPVGEQDEIDLEPEDLSMSFDFEQIAEIEY